MNYPTFKKGEAVIIYDGSKRRNSLELAEIANDSGYAEDEVIITFGNFNVRQSKINIHKLPVSLKKQIKEDK